MALKEMLKDIVENVSGGVGAVVMGYDGIPIDEYVINDASFDIPLLAVEYATVMKEIKRTVDVLKIGEMEEISINTNYLRAIIRVVDEELFVVLAVSSEGNYGKGRYLLKLKAPQLREYLM
jgi:predicted regulator of Ras-like GTPase activity (Roadblock/LC7/MglB family)